MHDDDKIEATKVEEKEYLPNENDTVVIDEDKNTTSTKESKTEDIQSKSQINSNSNREIASLSSDKPKQRSTIMSLRPRRRP